jgi:hypothetical protein
MASPEFERWQNRKWLLCIDISCTPKKIEEDTPTEIVIHSDKLLFYLFLGCYNIIYGLVIFELARLDCKKDPEEL